MNLRHPACPACDADIEDLDDKEIDAFGIVDGVEWEISIVGDCPSCGARLSVYSSSPEAHVVPDRFSVVYDGGVEVEVSEAEARDAFPDYKQAMGAEGEYEDHAEDSAEWAARRKLTDFMDSFPDDISLETEECSGIQRVQQ